MLWLYYVLDVVDRLGVWVIFNGRCDHIRVDTFLNEWTR